jgi:hypothetical protein
VNIKNINGVSSYHKNISGLFQIFLKKAKYAYTINRHINMLPFARKDRNKEKRAILIERKRKKFAIFMTEVLLNKE